MTLVTSSAWIAEAEERRRRRDEVRRRFVAKVGIAPSKSLDGLDIRPADQVEVIRALVSDANRQSSVDIAHALSALTAALDATGLAQGGAMAAVGTTAMRFADFVPLNLAASHFISGDADD